MWSIDNFFNNLQIDCITPAFIAGYGVISNFILAQGVIMAGTALTTTAIIAGIAITIIGASGIYTTLILLSAYSLTPSQAIRATVQRLGYVRIILNNAEKFRDLVLLLPLMPIILPLGAAGVFG